MTPDPALIGWYYKRGERRFGPHSIAEVARLLSDGRLRPTDMLIEIAEVPEPGGPGVRYSYIEAASAVHREDAARQA